MGKVPAVRVGPGAPYDGKHGLLGGGDVHVEAPDAEYSIVFSPEGVPLYATVTGQPQGAFNGAMLHAERPDPPKP